MLLPRLATFALAIGLTLLGTLFFDRFDTSGVRLRRPKPASKMSAASLPGELTAITAEAKALVRLTPLAASPARFRFASLFLAELRLLLNGLPWWWYLAAPGAGGGLWRFAALRACAKMCYPPP